MIRAWDVRGPSRHPRRADARVPKENLLGELNGALVHLMTNLAQERITIAIAAIAGAEHLLEITKIMKELISRSLLS
ncbi:hypothetical protein GCM10022295_48800 [Streptomyces osmaniensis]|uniref:Uncharacterized protein n=1 Tax=Streptomyces osmaniensis TaxID=593134 RepID=A0ABP6X5T5_9ACTN